MFCVVSVLCRGEPSVDPDPSIVYMNVYDTDPAAVGMYVHNICLAPNDIMRSHVSPRIRFD